jgi:hypothetical protein
VQQPHRLRKVHHLLSERATSPGHIGGAPAREPSRNVENSRDLNGRSDNVADGGTKVNGTLAQDPAYTPTYVRWRLRRIRAVRHQAVDRRQEE